MDSRRLEELGAFLKIFQPIYARRLEKTRLERMRFAYYTSASTGINILKGHALWMRAAACMNDYREIDYGIQLLNKTVYGSDYRRERIQHLAERLDWGTNVLDSMMSDLNKKERVAIQKGDQDAVDKINKQQLKVARDAMKMYKEEAWT